MRAIARLTLIATGRGNSARLENSRRAAEYSRIVFSLQAVSMNDQNRP